VTEVVSSVAGLRVLWCTADGPVLDGDRAAGDLVGAALGRADVVAVPIARVAPARAERPTAMRRRLRTHTAVHI
jgi:hypothetical protein